MSHKLCGLQRMQHVLQVLCALGDATRDWYVNQTELELL